MIDLHRGTLNSTGSTSYISWIWFLDQWMVLIISFEYINDAGNILGIYEWENLRHFGNNVQDYSRDI